MLDDIAADPKCSNENIQGGTITEVINFQNVIDIVSISYPIK